MIYYRCMQKILLILIAFALVAFVAVLFMYAENKNIILPEEPAELSGFVFSINNNRILVADGLAQGVGEYAGAIDELYGSATWFTVTNETEITDINGNEMSYSDIKINAGVRVYSTGPLLLSYPAQGGADRIVLTGETFTQAKDPDFEKTGNIAINNPGFEEDVWYLIHEAPGQPALFEKLFFDENSVCIYEEDETECDLENFTQGSRVKVIGEKIGDAVNVFRLIFEE